MTAPPNEVRAGEIVTAERVDPEARIAERVTVSADRSPALFACFHQPLDRAWAALVVCPPLDPDFTVNYRRYVVLARLLASDGVRVVRFHYRGTGHSAGDPADTSYQDLVEDALHAAGLASSETGRLCVMGGGWGALISASVARSLPGAPLVLWDPIDVADRYYREARRARLIATMRNSAPDNADNSSPFVSPDGAASLDVAGYVLHRRLEETSRGRNLVEELGPTPRSVLLVQSRDEVARSQWKGEVVDTWRGQGLSVEECSAGSSASTWFPAEKRAESPSDTARSVGACVVQWLRGEALS